MSRIIIGIVYTDKLKLEDTDYISSVTKLLNLICFCNKNEPLKPEFTYRFYNGTDPDFIKLFSNEAKKIFNEDQSNLIDIQNELDIEEFMNGLMTLYIFSDNEEAQDVLKLFEEKFPGHRSVLMDINSSSGVKSALNLWNKSAALSS